MPFLAAARGKEGTREWGGRQDYIPSEQVSSLIDSRRLSSARTGPIYFSLLVMLSKRKTSIKEGKKKITEDEEKYGTLYINLREKRPFTIDVQYSRLVFIDALCSSVCFIFESSPNVYEFSGNPNFHFMFNRSMQTANVV